MKNTLFTFVYFLFFSCYGLTIGKSMQNNFITVDDDWELSKKYSLISGFDFSKDQNKAAITLGMRTKPGDEDKMYHAYLAFEIFEDNEISLTGIDLVPKIKGSSVADHKTRSRSHVITRFGRYKKSGVVFDAKYEKVKSFIVRKEDARKALSWAITCTPSYCSYGSPLNIIKDDDKMSYTCCSYVDKVLNKAEVNLGRNMLIPLIPEYLITLAENYKIFSFYPKDFTILFKDVENKEKDKDKKIANITTSKKESDTASWNKTIVVGLGATGLIGLAYSGSYEVIISYLSSLGLM